MKCGSCRQQQHCSIPQPHKYFLRSTKVSQTEKGAPLELFLRVCVYSQEIKVVRETGRFDDDDKLVLTGGAPSCLQDLRGFDTLRFIVFGCRLEAADARIKSEAHL